jgi:glyoxylase-like metal-dependent hydrolase (beta-lactamase superfamily II)
MLKTAEFEGVTQITMGREIEDFGGQVLYWVSAYLVGGLLIDTGCVYTSEELANYLVGKKLRCAVNTHYHEDHIGGNRLLKERFGIEVFAHRDSLPLINQTHKLYWYQETVWGYPEPTSVLPLSKMVETDDFRFDVVETPSHCKGHIALVEPEKGWCFSGDIFVGERPKVIRPEDDIAQTIRDLEKLIDLGTDRLVLFTSIGRIVEDGREKLQACVDYFQRLSREAKALKEEGLSIPEIRDKLLGGEATLGYLGTFADLTEGDFSGERLVESLLR